MFNIFLSYVYRIVYIIFIVVISIILLITLLLFQFRKKIILQNIKIIFLNKKPLFILIRLYFNTTILFYSFFISKFIKTPKTSSRVFDKISDLKKEGGVILTAHYDNWEIGGSHLKKIFKLNIKAVSTVLKSNFWQNIIKKQRIKHEIPIINTNVSRETISWVKNGGIICFILDQFQIKGKKVVFFKQQIKVNPLPMKMCAILSKPCYAFFIYKNKIRVFCLYNPKIHQSDVNKIYKRYMKILEILIINQPTRWLCFFHKIFKTSCDY